MKKLIRFLMVFALLFGATEVQAGEGIEFLLGMAGSVVAHEFVGHGVNNPDGAEQKFELRSITGWSSFRVANNQNKEEVFREASINGLFTQTFMGEAVWSSGAAKKTVWGKGFVLGNALYQTIYPLYTIVTGGGELGIDLKQYEEHGGSRATKYALLALGSYRLFTLMSGHDPLSDGKGVELVAGIDVESGGLNVNLNIPF